MEGSSPLARGLPASLRLPTGRLGIIPARAGSTETLRGRILLPSDHPRSRGVYLASSAVEDTAAGSSPLARGLPRWGHGSQVRCRIIPARAGSTQSRNPGWRERSDHPRSRGVYYRILSAATRKAGSSPLARGLPRRQRRGHAGRRIIPARAGSTAGRPRRRCSGTDHPRSRGVYAADMRPICVATGSSPLARGLRQHSSPMVNHHRIIPARAGSTRNP